MGYGGSRKDAGRQLGRTGDGGIDGEIREDKLGFERIYVQAKRYAEGNMVAPHQVRDFYGAIHSRRSRKGVFLTTSAFTDDALAFAEPLNELVLVNGRRLAELMYEHGIGVTVARVIEIKRLDADFFSDDVA